jgi:hypothetical protein
MLERKHARQLPPMFGLGNQVNQFHRYANTKANLEEMFPRRQPALLKPMIALPAPTIQVANGIKIVNCASKKLNGSRSGTFTLHQPDGLWQQITWLAPSRMETNQMIM